MTIMQATLLLFLVFFGLMFIGVPISVSIGCASIIVLFAGFEPGVLAYVVAQRCFKGIDSFALLALPFFMLAGSIMNKGGIARRLVRLARFFVGKIPGYLAATNVLTNMFFGAISGSSVAAASAVGKIMGPLEKDEGYEDAYSAAVNICSAPTGVIIPPSGPLILYSITAGSVSVSALFMAGYIPGVLLGVCVMAVAIFLAKKKGYTGSTVEEKDSIGKVLIDAIPSIFMMVIVMGGILLGWFTATEAGVVACLYCIVLGFAYRELTIKQLWSLMSDCMMDTAVILFLIAASNIMSYTMSYSGIPAALSSTLMGITDNKYILLLIMNVFLLVLGMFLDLTPAVLIFTPIFLPIATSFGMSPVHFGIMLILNLAIGSVTPPVGSVLFVGCNVGGVSVEKVTKYIVPMFCAMVVALMLVVYIPQLSLLIPKLCGLI
ncbi:TRAP transporter large permease [Mediterraneibacter agrestimuris]|uniref:TRAP transporter large permease n=1 Tax=Mediterraneibacter agrestimuris TaxID=2941333 RepID=UPI00203D843D|nr:TRAP transporter large permease [Mediterraneibacter agrestimuris]